MKRTPNNILALLLGLLVCCIACSGGKFRSNEELAQLAGSSEEYYVSGGDVLDIKVWGEPRLSGEVYVREDGKFTMALIDEVDAKNKTLMQINDEISQRLTEFIPAVSVTTSVVQASPVRFFLTGQFQKPGEYRSDKSITLLQAIAKAGGFLPFAETGSIMLIRNTEEGEARYRLDYDRVVDGRDPNPLLKNGDVISVN